MLRMVVSDHFPPIQHMGVTQHERPMNPTNPEVDYTDEAGHFHIHIPTKLREMGMTDNSFTRECLLDAVQQRAFQSDRFCTVIKRDLEDEIVVIAAGQIKSNDLPAPDAQ